MRVVGGKHVRLMGRADNGVRDGLYRDHLEIRTASGSGLNAINAVDLDDYLMGVVPSESPSVVAGRGARRPRPWRHARTRSPRT